MCTERRYIIVLRISQIIMDRVAEGVLCSWRSITWLLNFTNKMSQFMIRSIAYAKLPLSAVTKPWSLSLSTLLSRKPSCTLIGLIKTCVDKVRVGPLYLSNPRVWYTIRQSNQSFQKREFGFFCISFGTTFNIAHVFRICQLLTNWNTFVVVCFKLKLSDFSYLFLLCLDVLPDRLNLEPCLQASLI